MNGFGIINFVDYQILYDYIEGKIELTDEQKAKADISGDGEVRAADAALLAAYINGKYKI